MKQLLLSVLLAAGFTVGARAQVYITEWQYNGSEFVEFTNLGSSAVNFTGWSFDDDSRTADSFVLSAFGLVAAGESVIVCEGLEADFRNLWNLSGSVKIIGGNTQNLGRNDEINLYNASDVLVDRLTFGDQNISGSIRTDTASGWASYADLHDNNVLAWTKSVVGDAQGSLKSDSTYIGNPGTYAVPEPGTITLLFSAGIGLVLWRLRRRKVAA